MKRSPPPPFVILQSRWDYATRCFFCLFSLILFWLTDTEKIASIRFCHGIFVASLDSINLRQPCRWHPSSLLLISPVEHGQERQRKAQSPSTGLSTGHQETLGPHSATWTWWGTEDSRTEVSLTLENLSPNPRYWLCCVTEHSNIKAAAVGFPASWPACDG